MLILDPDEFPLFVTIASGCNVYSICVGLPNLSKYGTALLGRTQSINPLFNTNVPHPLGHLKTPVGGLLVADDEDDNMTACCRTFTTSSGVTARAVTMEPMLPDAIRGRREEERLDDDDAARVTASSSSLLSSRPALLVLAAEKLLSSSSPPLVENELALADDVSIVSFFDFIFFFFTFSQCHKGDSCRGVSSLFLALSSFAVVMFAEELEE